MSNGRTCVSKGGAMEKMSAQDPEDVVRDKSRWLSWYQPHNVWMFMRILMSKLSCKEVSRIDVEVGDVAVEGPRT